MSNRGARCTGRSVGSPFGHANFGNVFSGTEGLGSTCVNLGTDGLSYQVRQAVQEAKDEMAQAEGWEGGTASRPPSQAYGAERGMDLSSSISLVRETGVPAREVLRTELMRIIHDIVRVPR